MHEVHEGLPYHVKSPCVGDGKTLVPSCTSCTCPEIKGLVCTRVWTLVHGIAYPKDSGFTPSLGRQNPPSDTD